MKTPPAFFLNFVQSTIPLTLFVALLFWLNEQSCQICYFAEWYYGPKLVEPWYCSICSSLLCILCNKASSLMKGLIWMTWFLQEIWFGITQSHTGHKGNNRLTYTYQSFPNSIKGWEECGILFGGQCLTWGVVIHDSQRGFEFSRMTSLLSWAFDLWHLSNMKVILAFWELNCVDCVPFSCTDSFHNVHSQAN